MQVSPEFSKGERIVLKGYMKKALLFALLFLVDFRPPAGGGRK